MTEIERRKVEAFDRIVSAQGLDAEQLLDVVMTEVRPYTAPNKSGIEVSEKEARAVFSLCLSYHTGHELRRLATIDDFTVRYRCSCGRVMRFDSEAIEKALSCTT